MSARRRPGSWQDEVAKGFSRLFSRSSSQEKDEEGSGEEQDKSDRSLSRLFFRGPSQDKTDRGPQEEQERSPSRLFLRRGTQEGKGTSAEQGADRDPQEDQERSRGFSRLFTKSSSQEKSEDDHDTSRSGEEDNRHEEKNEEKNSNLALDLHERLFSSQTEEVKEEQSSSSSRQVTSESEEEKDTEFKQNSKVIDSEKQSRENFFHFIGNLFHFSPKASLGNAKQVDSTQELCKEHEDTQVKNNLDKEDAHQEQTRDVSTSETEHTAEFRPALTELSVESNTEIPKETIKQEQQETPPTRPKLNGYPQEAPAVTYGTYRGSRRIRKLLKRRADVNSPIPEKEETSEKESNTEDVGMEDHHMLLEIESMETSSYRSSEEEMPPSEMQIKMKIQPKVQVTSQNRESNSQEDELLKQNAENSSITSAPSQNGEIISHEEKNLKQNAEISSPVSLANQNNELFAHEVEDFNTEICSDISGSMKLVSTAYLKISNNLSTNPEMSSNISESVQVNEQKSLESSKDLQLKFGKESNFCLDLSPHNNDNSNISVDSQTNLEPNNLRQNSGESLSISSDIQRKGEESVNILEDLWETAKILQPNKDESPKCPSELKQVLEKNTEIEFRKDLAKSVGIMSESTQSILLVSDKNLEKKKNSGTNLDNEQKPIKEYKKLNEVEYLTETEKLQPQAGENSNISEQPHLNREEMPKITADQQPYGYVHLSIQRDLQKHKDDNCKLEETNADVVSEGKVVSAVQSREVPHNEQEIVTNGNLTVKDYLHPKHQTKANENPLVIGQQQIIAETSDDTLNQFNSESDDDTSETILVNDNVKPVPENLSNGSSHIPGTARTVSFDNGIECRSPSPTISDSPSSTDCMDIRCDSPLPLSDAIDSGMVSSQAYTPEEHMPTKILTSEILNKSISDPFNMDLEDKRTRIVELEIETEAPVNDYSVKELNEPLIEGTESQTEADSSPGVEHAFLVDSGVSDVDVDVSGRLSPNDIMKVSLNSDVYVAKVSVKSVNIEEVKLAPYEFQSDIISVSKVESATFEKELIHLPNFSPPPSESGGDREFKDISPAFQQDKNKIVTNTEMPSARNLEKDLTVNNANLSFHEPSLFQDFNNYEKSPHSNYLESERFPSLNKIDLVENVVNMFPNVGDNITPYTFIEKGLPILPEKSPDVLIENLKNNNLTIDTTDDIINLSLQTNTSENELANESLISDDSHWELQSCDSLSEFHPNDDVTHKDPVKERDVILQSTFQRDVNLTDDINSSDSATSKISLPRTENSELPSESFEEKASEIIFSVLHSAIGEFQNLNKNHTNVPSLGTVKERLDENHLVHIAENHSEEDKGVVPEKPSTNIQSLTTDPVVSLVASKLVNDVIYSSKQFMLNSLDKKSGTNKICTPTSVVSVNGPDKNAKHSNNNISLLNTDHSILLNSYEVNSNAIPPTPASDSFERTEENSDVKWLGGTEDIINDSRHQDRERSPNGFNGQVDSSTNSEATIQDDRESKNATFAIGLGGDQGGLSSKSVETEGSMNMPFINNLLGENPCISGTEFIDPFQFSLYNSKYVEIGSDDDSAEEESRDNGQASATDLFLTVPTRRVRIYPLSLSPIYEDDSSCEDVSSNSSSPRHKKGTATGGGANDHTSILSLLQSVSDRLKEANVEETCLEGKLSSLSEAAAVSDLDNIASTGTQEILLAPIKSHCDAQKMLSEDTTSGAKLSSMFITKAANKPNPGASRQSLLLNVTPQSTTLGSKPSIGNNSTVIDANESSPSAKSESRSFHNKDMSSDPAPVTALSPLQMVTDSGLSAPKPEMKCQPRMSSKSVYYQYFHSSQNYPNENKESPTEEKVDLRSEKESKETEMRRMDSSCLKFNPRPGKVILSDVIHHEKKIELKGDALDATSWVFPNGVNIRVIRGCWILYEKPHFEGQAHVLEEGEAVLLHLWDPPGATAKPDKVSIGSVKRVVKDYLPEVVISPLEDTSDSPVYIHSEVPSLEHLVDRRPRSLTVNSGVWLTYTEPQYTGTVSVLEEGCNLPQIQACGVKSMRPLKMGGLKVQLPNDPKIIIYQKPHFQGWSREITEHASSIGKLISDGDNPDPLDVGSIRVVGGIWVGYEKERYKGYQYLLEEGEYEDWQAWGGCSSILQSIRYLQANFLEASVTLLESDSEEGKYVELYNQAIPDLELAGYKTRPQCIHVKKGMWVAYQQKHYCGEQYILEKGRYKSHVDWGGSSNAIMSIRPVLLEPLGRNEVKHLIKAYESTHFQGESVDFTQEASDFISFMPKSFKVLRGCWLLYYQTDACDNVCVLEEGHFPDLASCGCPAAEIRYIKPIDYVFADPSISVFALDSCEGRELHFEESVTSVLSEDLHFYTQSVWIRRGLWIAFEGASFLGRQMLLDPQRILNWSKYSGWKAIGSLRPLKQPAVYFMVRNRHKDKYLTVTGKLSDTRATFVSVSSRNGQSSQIWYFSRGLLKSKANDSCLDIIGGKNVPGSKVSLWAEHGKTRQKWKINKDGTVSSYISDELVLDIKGGNYYDQNYLIVNKSQQSALTQKWDIEIL